jgi:hypothetical protein
MMFLKKDVVLAVVVPPVGGRALVIFSPRAIWRTGDYSVFNDLASITLTETVLNGGFAPQILPFWHDFYRGITGCYRYAGASRPTISIFLAGRLQWNAQYAGPACRA